MVGFTASVLYLLPAVLHQMTDSKLHTLFFVALFVVFLCFDLRTFLAGLAGIRLPIDPERPLPTGFLGKLVVFLDTKKSQLHAIASAVILLSIAGMIGLGFFDPKQRSALGGTGKAFFMLILLVAALLASPFEEVFRTALEEGSTSPFPSLQNTHMLQRALNSGILGSLIVLTLAIFVTYRYLRVQLPKHMADIPSYKEADTGYTKLLPDYSIFGNPR
jgi:hypothetical protein